jgi:hypothetical protein
MINRLREDDMILGGLGKLLARSRCSRAAALVIVVPLPRADERKSGEVPWPPDYGYLERRMRTFRRPHLRIRRNHLIIHAESQRMRAMTCDVSLGPENVQEGLDSIGPADDPSLQSSLPWSVFANHLTPRGFVPPEIKTKHSFWPHSPPALADEFREIRGGSSPDQTPPCLWTKWSTPLGAAAKNSPWRSSTG